MTAGCTLPLRGNQANGCTLVVPGLAGLLHSPRRERLLARLRMKSDRKAAETRGVVRLTTAGLEKHQTEECNLDSKGSDSEPVLLCSPELLQVSAGFQPPVMINSV